MGMHTGTSNFPETTDCTSQNDGAYVALQTVFPPQQ
jgi:hypothetical protein